MEPLPGDYKKNREQAKEDAKQLTRMQEEEKKKKVFEFRPPNLWNEPLSVAQDHDFKSSANPFEIYSDPRVKSLYTCIEQLGQLLRNGKDPTQGNTFWKNMVERVIEVYKNEEEEQLNESNM